jgi:hypothetical protein
VSKRKLAVLVMLAGWMAACGDEGPNAPVEPEPEVTIDTIPPAAIEGLHTRSATQQSLALAWTAPGDDGDDGVAAEYDIRYGPDFLTEDNWDTATQFEGEPAPKPAGDPETVRIGGLETFTAYQFGIKARDEAGNESPLSNIASGTTLQEALRPGPITDLRAAGVGSETFELTWTAPAEDGYVGGRASHYDLRHHPEMITESNWSSATPVDCALDPGEPGTEEHLHVEGLRGTLNYHFAIKTADEVPNWSEVSNDALAIGGLVDLYCPASQVYKGQELEIFFRAPGDEYVAVHLHRWSFTEECHPAGTHPWVIADIVMDTKLPAGLHSVTFDFKALNGEYLPTAEYFVVLCWSGTFRKFRSVQFSDLP